LRFFSSSTQEHVPSCGFYPLEAVKTDVFATAKTIDATIKNDVKQYLF
jgi:UDP-N-acetylglucosamine 4,6-dehydratase